MWTMFTLSPATVKLGYTGDTCQFGMFSIYGVWLAIKKYVVVHI